MTVGDADSALRQRARLAVIWQDLVTPARALAGYQEILSEQAANLGLDEVAPYFEKVMISAGLLCEVVDQLRDPPADTASVEDKTLADMQGTFRHDLRTPLNAIIGYSEMALEDLEGDPSLDTLRPDIDRLLTESRNLLDRIDAIVDLSGIKDGDLGENYEADAAVADLMRTLRTDAQTAHAVEVGRILVVDDNASNRDLLERRLSLEGHEVVAAESGRRALAILAEETFDLILLDLLMPGMNGIEVLERLKRDERLHDVPVIMISGLSETEAVARCIEAGAEDYLPKPFNLVILRARINACLERKRWRTREQEYLSRLRAERDRSEALLRNILPEPIVQRLNAGELTIADSFAEVSILFADLVNFTAAAARMTPERLVGKLNRIFSGFDKLAIEFGVEKIKTIGDAYMAVAGLPAARDDHAEAVVHFAIGMLDVIAEENAVDDATPFEIRVGIHTGPVVAGVIGRHKFIYDVWGNTVNVASRMESTGCPGRIHISDATERALRGRFAVEPRGIVELEGWGETNAFFLIGPAAGRP
jgi:class 3 adenylate cyclase